MGDFGASSPSVGGSDDAGAWLEPSAATSPEASVLLSSCSLDSGAQKQTYSHTHMQIRGHTTHFVYDESEWSHRIAMKPQEKAVEEGGERKGEAKNKQHEQKKTKKKQHIEMSETEKTSKDRNYRGHRLSHKPKERLSEEMTNMQFSFETLTNTTLQ